MKRTRLSDRKLPDYTRGEELLHTVSHGIGIAFGLAVLLCCLTLSACKEDPWGIAGSLIYGGSLILLYTMSTVYHGLPDSLGKRVMQVLDHCTIYYLIAGTYTPIVLCRIRPYAPAVAWIIFGFVWGCAIVGSVLTAIDLNRFAKFAMTCYIVMGWCIVLAVKPAIESVPIPALWWILCGGIAYTAGAVLYGLGKRRRYMHAAFHFFVLAGSVLQFIGIIGYVL